MSERTAAPMDGNVEAERAAIVAWLRGNYAPDLSKDEFYALSDNDQKETMFAAVIAAKIERGEHHNGESK